MVVWLECLAVVRQEDDDTSLVLPADLLQFEGQAGQLWLYQFQLQQPGLGPHRLTQHRALPPQQELVGEHIPILQNIYSSVASKSTGRSTPTSRQRT